MVVIVLLAMFLWRGSSAPTPPGPVPPTPNVITEDVAKITEDAHKQMLSMEADIAKRVADEIKAKKIKSASTLFANVKAWQDYAETESFKKLNELNDKYLAGDGSGWTDEQIKLIEEFQKLKEEGKRRLLK
jgi:hypothetical protein